MMKMQTILMFPWLAHGHILAFLELAKKLSNTNLFNIFFCSTPPNLELVKNTLINECVSHSITLIQLKLTPLPDVPSPHFTEIMKRLSPDLLIYDINQPWAPLVAANLGIPAVVLITTSGVASMCHFYAKVAHSSKDKDEDPIIKCVAHSSEIVLVESFKEIEGKYAHNLSILTGKKVVLVGPLVATSIPHMKQNNVIPWLDTKDPGSTVFVSFGSEYLFSDNELEEIAHGLESSNVNFIWLLRFSKVESKINISEALPFGFLERVKSRGLVVEGWVPQEKILGHKSIGGFVSDCEWHSVLEAMKYGVPIISMPMHLDQPINARLVVDVGVGVEVPRDEMGFYSQEDVVKVVEQVVVSRSGKFVRETAKKISVDMRAKNDEEIQEVVTELLINLCKSGSGRGYVLQKAKSEGYPIG